MPFSPQKDRCVDHWDVYEPHFYQTEDSMVLFLGLLRPLIKCMDP